MTKPKQKYHVYRVGIGEGCYARNYRRDFVGFTWAVSEKQARSLVRYRVLHNEKFDLIAPMYDSRDEGMVNFHLEAVPAEEDPYAEPA